ncbi:MAG: DUF1501 domain-containing protein [Verrucomicrobia bacterium]|nr:DUF1501 domain-containing protein [Verrucomicrobiota bacterium]
MKQIYRYCDGIDRRDFLRIGAVGLLGIELSLPALLERQARAAGASGPKRDVSVIWVFLKGGMSTIDTFDLKPDAPSDIRGEFKSIPTRIPGLHVSEHLPKVAGQMDKFSLVRSFGHRNADHGPADHYMLTGYHPIAGFNPNLKPNNQYPSFGSVIGHKLGSRSSVPPYVCLPILHASAGSAFLGPSAVPFVIEADPSAPSFSVPDLAPPMALDASRLAARRELLASVDRYQRAAEVRANSTARSVSVFGQRAFDLMTSPEAKKAFDIAEEPEKLRDEYGRHTLGQSCLMGRRLVEAGVRCVMIDHSNWDTHFDNFTIMKTQLLPKFDAAISTLFRDLADRGLLESTLVIISGEFGRTPRINKDAGRDHWSKCFTLAIGGGGIQGGRVVGTSDAWAQEPAENPYGPEDLAATLYHLLRIDPKGELRTPEGRPIALSNDGRIIRELV